MKGEATRKVNGKAEDTFECWKAQYSYDASNYLFDAVRKLRGENHILKMRVEEQEKRLKLFMISVLTMALALLIHIFC